MIDMTKGNPSKLIIKCTAYDFGEYISTGL